MTTQTYVSFVNLNLSDQMRSLQKGNLKRYYDFENALKEADLKKGTIYKEETIKINCYKYMAINKRLNTGKHFVKQVWEKKTISERIGSKQNVGEIIENNVSRTISKHQLT